jgi:hypothetical protein
MRVGLCPIVSIRPYENNPRIDELAVESIRFFRTVE